MKSLDKLLVLDETDFPWGTIESLHYFLSQQEVIQETAKEFEAGKISDDEIREFVAEHVIKGFKTGFQINKRYALCGLLIASQNNKSEATKELFRELIEINYAELSICSMMARCIVRKSNAPVV